MDGVTMAVEDLGGTSPLSSEQARRLVSAVGDIALVLDSEGIVQSVALGGTHGAEQATKAWVGRCFADTVTPDAREALADLVREATTSGVAAMQQLSHPSPVGPDVPIAYTVLRLDDDDRLLFVGRDLRAVSGVQRRLMETQQAMEQDYWRLRQAESRYRLLFKIGAEAILVVDADTLRVLDANIAAGQLLEIPADTLVGRAATTGFDRDSKPAVEELLASARVQGQRSQARALLVDGRTEAVLSATPFRSDGSTLLLLQVDALGSERQAPDATLGLADLLERIPDAVVVTDPEARVVTANPAFLDLAQLVSLEHARGRSLGEWLGRPGNDLAMILAILKNHGSVRALPTAARGEHGETTEVELSAAVVSGDGSSFIGFVVRDVSRRTSVSPQTTGDLSLAVQRLTGLVGRVSLPELVRDTTELVERHLIRAALELTGGNRTTAAEVLGLSRQSLYVKLRRRGLHGDDGSQPKAEAAH